MQERENWTGDAPPVDINREPSDSDRVFADIIEYGMFDENGGMLGQRDWEDCLAANLGASVLLASEGQRPEGGCEQAAPKREQQASVAQ